MAHDFISGRHPELVLFYFPQAKQVRAHLFGLKVACNWCAKAFLAFHAPNQVTTV
jgi:hypothetical protein